MLTKKQIVELFEALNVALAKRSEIGEVGVVGGAAMCLVFDARASTKDVDGIFKPAALIRDLVAKVGEEKNVDRDWLNDAAKGYLEGKFGRVDVFHRSHLRVWAPEARYLLAMKCLSSRWDTLDRNDVQFLVRHLGLNKKEQVFAIIEEYYPKNRILPKTQFFLEELFDAIKVKKKAPKK